MNWRGALALTMLVVLAAITWWLLQTETAPPREPAPTAPEQPDYYFRDALITRLDKETGKPELQLGAADIRHLPQAAVSELATVRLEYYARDGAYWIITALRGELPDAGDVIILQGDVRIIRPDEEPPLEAVTEFLEVNTETHFATTDETVTIRQGASRISGTGLSAWLDEKRLQMHTQVRGHYEK